MDILNGNQCIAETPGAIPTEPCRPETHEMQVKEVENGFVVRVGCKHFVALSWDELAGKLGEYFKDPIAARKKYCKN